MVKKILVTGGYGYIGSHTVVALLALNYEVVVVDDLSNSKLDVGEKIDEISGKTHKFFELDLLNKNMLMSLFKSENPDLVIHFAGLKAVAESVKDPATYYHTNVGATLNLLSALEESSCRDIIFSSSATVYGLPVELPIQETHRVGPTNPYGWSKFFCEQIINDWVKVNSERSGVILRYFNPIGAHDSGLIGDNPNCTPNNLMPILVSTAKGSFEEVKVFGNDYQTIDGTGVRDYLHVVDLAEAHIAALTHYQSGRSLVYNIGTGKGTSVLELIEIFARVNSIKLNYKNVGRRDGDVASVYAATQLANDHLNWKARLDIECMCQSAWKFGCK